MTRELTEAEIVTKLVRHLSPYFNISKEVKDVTGKSRIDLVLQDKNNTEVYFGVEVKRVNRKRGASIGEHIKQGIRYSETEFIIGCKKRKLPILLAPPISYIYLICPNDKQTIDGKEYFSDRHQDGHTHHTVNGMLGVFLIGEIRKLGSATGFMFSNKLLWNSRKIWERGKQTEKIEGTNIKNYNNLIQQMDDNSISGL
jgi:hypothetical protein